MTAKSEVSTLFCHESLNRPPPSIPKLKELKIASKSAVAASIAAVTNPLVLKAAAAALAAMRRKTYRKTVRMSDGLFKRTAVYMSRITGCGNTILLPPVTFSNWFGGLSGGTTTGYMQTIGLARGIDTIYKVASRYGINVVACNEMYTSRECSCCRDCDYHTATRTYTCTNCGLVTHRDAGNSTVNILIRAVAFGHDVNQALLNRSSTLGEAVIEM
jgi:hypothetical protein